MYSVSLPALSRSSRSGLGHNPLTQLVQPEGQPLYDPEGVEHHSQPQDELGNEPKDDVHMSSFLLDVRSR